MSGAGKSGRFPIPTLGIPGARLGGLRSWGGHPPQRFYRGGLVGGRRVVPALLALVIAVSGLVVALGSPAAARVIEQGPIHEELSGVDDDFCGAGLSVAFDGVIDGRYQVETRGRTDVGYYMDHVRVENVLTDQATGQTATDLQPNTLGKDLKITDNADGTVTVIVLLTGGARTYGDDGRLIAKNSGQVRFRNVVDAETFVPISSELIFGSTGTNDDFCTAVLTDWGYL